MDQFSMQSTVEFPMMMDSIALLIARDTALAGLELLWNPTELWRKICEQSDHTPCSSEAPELVYSRYKPQRRCLALYRTNGNAQSQWFYAVAHVAESWPKYAARFETVRQLCPDWRIWTLPEQRIALHPFPADPRLSIGRVFSDAATRFAFLRRLFPKHPGWWHGSLKVMAYKPERRCAAQLMVDDEPTACLKFYASGDYDAALLRARMFRSRDLLQVANVIGRSHRHHVIATNWIPGETWKIPEYWGKSQRQVVENIGGALATLHQHPSDSLASHCMANVETDLRQLANDLSALLPGEQSRLNRMADQLISRWDSGEHRVTITHGDFYARQVVPAAPTIGFIDFDQARLDDPLVDVGNFIAHLRYDCMRSIAGRYASRSNITTTSDLITPARADDLCQNVSAALLAGYEATVKQNIDRRWLSLSTAIGLFRLLPRPFRCLEPDWPAQTVSLMDAIEAQIRRASENDQSLFPLPRYDKGGRIGIASCVLPDVPPTADETMPWVADCLKPALVTRALPTCETGFGAGSVTNIVAARVVRHKPGRRCLIEYQWEPPRDDRQRATTIFGKIRARGVDERTYRLHGELHNRFATSLMEAGVVVAPPVGIIPAWRMWLQEKLPGTSPWDDLTVNDNTRIGCQIARAIATFHQIPIRVDRRHDQGHEICILRQRLQPLVARHSQGTSIGKILAKCELVATQIETRSRPALVHRDFYPDQLLIEGDQTAILDLDLCCRGDGELDVGNFIAHLIEWSFRHGLEPPKLDSMIMAMCDTYLSETPGASLKAIHDYQFLSLARHIELSTRLPGRSHATERLIDYLLSSL